MSPVPRPTRPLRLRLTPEQGARLCLTFTRSGKGVIEVFEYDARWEYELAVDAWTMHAAERGDDSVGQRMTTGASACALCGVWVGVVRSWSMLRGRLGDDDVRAKEETGAA
ncbi:hypothetical protein EIP86_009430 [Pleurotus ostreatoroseus]|nr:hypothetical protein EIP86_009430 [Pleurotus ostreatoroseus]